MATSPIQAGSNIISFDIKVDGKSCAQTIEVISISTEAHGDGTSNAEILLRDGSFDNAFSVSDSDAFKLGSDIEILLGYEQGNAQVFKGLVASLDITSPNEQGPTLTVDAVAKPTKVNVEEDPTPSLELTYGLDVLDYHLSIYKVDIGFSKIKLDGFILFQGSNNIMPNDAVSLKGFAKDHNGVHLVKRVHHLVSDGQWTTEVEV
jgi:phage protein D